MRPANNTGSQRNQRSDSASRARATDSDTSTATLRAV
jgi:hypothetical protein